ncbi:MAG: hypothetical protein ACRC9Z_10365 [Weissella confusa]
MSKYKVTREFMNALSNWRDERNLDAASNLDGSYVNGIDIRNFTNSIDTWWLESTDSVEHNKRMIAIIKWLNGKDVFEVEKPHKFLVRSVEENDVGEPLYLELKKEYGLMCPTLRKIEWHYVICYSYGFGTLDD